MSDDFNLATLWVPVVPEVSQVGKKIEDAGEEAKRKWSEKVKDFGKTITDDLQKAGDKTKDIFAKAGSDSSGAFADSFKDLGANQWGGIVRDLGKNLGDEFGAKIGDSLGDSLGNRFRDVLGNSSRAVGDFFDNVTKSADQVRGGIQSVHDVIASLNGGDVGSALSGISGAFDHISTLTSTVGIDINGLKGPLGDVLGTAGGIVGQFDSMKGGIQEFAGLTESLAPGISAALSSALGPLSIAATGLSLIIGGLPGIGGGLSQILAAPDPTQGFQSPIQGPPIEQTPAAQMPLPGQTQPAAPPPGAPPGVRYRASQGSLDPFSALLPPGMAPPDLSTPVPIAPADTGGMSTAPAPFTVPPHQAPPPVPPPTHFSAPSSVVAPSSVTGGVGSHGDLAAAGSRVGALYSLAGALEGTPYSQPLRNDCSGMVAQLAAVAVGLPPPSAGERFSTPNEGAWLASHGFQPGMGPEGSFRVGWNPAPGNAGHTAATLPGGEHAESGGRGGGFRVGRGAAGADDPQFSMHAWLPMDGSAPSTPRFGGADASGRSIPVGTEHDPLYVTHVSGGAGGAAGGSPFEGQGEQLAQGLGKGALEMLGLDGSVFGGKSPLDFGAVKLGMGALSWGIGKARALSGQGTDGASMPALGGGGGGSMLGGLGGLIPSAGAMISAGAQPGPGGSLGISGAGPAPGPVAPVVNNDNSLHIHSPVGNPTPWIQQGQFEQNSRSYGISSGLPKT
jgi:hypothetical protein